MESCVELCAITDGDYAVPAVVMLTSAKVHKAPESRYRVHLLLTSPNAWLEKKAQELSSPDFEMLVRHVELTPSERHLNENRHFSHISGTSLVRCRLASLMPDTERVLYLDGDILIRADLSDFFHADMEGKSLAGVWDIGEWDGENCHSRRVVGSESYMNSGVLLMNLKRMRESGLSAEIERVEENPPPEWPWVDQDILNSCCPDEEKLVLPPRYNCQLALYRLHAWDVRKVNSFYGTQYADMRELEEEALVIHLSGPHKPWNLLNCYGSELWMHYYQASPLSCCDWTRQVQLPPELLFHDATLAPKLRPIIVSMAEEVAGTHSASLASALKATRAALKAEVNVIRKRLEQRDRRVSVRDIRLFGFLPLLRVQWGLSAVRVRMFGFLPLVKLVCQNGRTRCLLFHFIPLLTIRSHH